MQLKGKQFQQLQKALLGAFPNRAKLKQMVRFGLEENLDAIATGENDEEAVFKLIDWAETNGNLENLLIAACNEDCGGNPGNSQLKRICEELLQGQTATEQSHALMNPCKFDLTELIAECRNNLLGKKGLVGFALPCEDYTFLENFCQRLLEEFKTRNIKKQPHLSLNSKYTSVTQAIKLIQQCKKNLRGCFKRVFWCHAVSVAPHEVRHAAQRSEASRYVPKTLDSESQGDTLRERSTPFRSE